MATHWHDAHFGSDMNQSALAVEDDSHFHDPFLAPPIMTRIGADIAFGTDISFGADELLAAFEEALVDDPYAIGQGVGGPSAGDSGMMAAFEEETYSDPYAIGQNLGL